MEKISRKKDSRINSIDSLRGFAVICMIIYHLIYDLIVLYGIIDLDLSLFYPFQQFICWSFIIISGISFNLSSNNLKASIKLIIVALIISLFTYIFMEDSSIKFGIIHLLGFSSLILTLIPRGNFSYIKVGLSFLVFIVFWVLDYRDYPFFQILSQYNLYPLGYPSPGFKSADYFPLLPWFFLYIFGYELGGILLQKHEEIIYKYDFNIGILSWLGRNSLLVYILHQPILIALIEIFLLFK